ncbi:SgcJ/EcaC family oxidoreductase [Saccharospirillum sp.]|uniref:SgcJ/EcaC family oxidoreductase n=1 Tax=Saccharospirillum sp. TaxID=2033801 RepID=UPI0034A0A90E
MQSDKDEICELVAKWMKATKEGDSDTVLSLMADDATFIVAGQPPFGKGAFASATNAQETGSMEIDGESEVLEITVAGEWAFMLSHLTVKVKSEGTPQMIRAGNTLTVLTKKNGRWLLYRDANLLVPVQESGDAT